MYIDHLKEHVHPLTMNCKALIERINPSVSTYAPAGGATKPITPFQTYDRVSIHAPAGGATVESSLNPHAYNVSIHAPAGGATFTTFYCCYNFLFQSTRLREARHFTYHCLPNR